MHETPPARVIIENVTPELDGGRFPIKRIVGDLVTVSADIFADGHQRLTAEIRYRQSRSPKWTRVAMHELGTDRWQGEFRVEQIGSYEYTVFAAIDLLASWRDGAEKKALAGGLEANDLIEGATLLQKAAEDASGTLATTLTNYAARLEQASERHGQIQIIQSQEFIQAISRANLWSSGSDYQPNMSVMVDPPHARFSSWYEIFPRSAANSGEHGTFRDLMKQLPRIRELGFDVLYLPPIHPIGERVRKGKNNSLQAEPGDLGSPWAIGSKAGGHTAIHPQLGTVADFRALRDEAERYDMLLALDIALHCSPDHPYLTEHPEWFRRGPTGEIKYAENPPKKYQDIYPFDFECSDWRSLWTELKRVFVYWIEQGVTIFRVDNPHTKPFRFWGWLIGELKREHPEVVLLSEAFTRPKLMYGLAKCGFNQSYTYFTWRNTKHELTEYLQELTSDELAEYFRPNFFANTPDILHAYLQHGGVPAFRARLVLAATLAASYGIYGPAFELCETRAVPGTEEYLGSEKYELREWDFSVSTNISPFISRVNEIRKLHRAFQYNRPLRFFQSDNDALLVYGKIAPDLSERFIVAVNLNPHQPEAGFVCIPPEELAFDASSYTVRDLLNDQTYTWQSGWNFVRLDPAVTPAHIFRIEL